jgi:hypothetical protein
MGEGYGQVKQAAPRLMENVEAGTNIALLGAGGIGRTKQISGTVERGGTGIVQKFLPSPKKLTSDELRTTASELYQKADELGGVFKPEVTN